MKKALSEAVQKIPNLHISSAVISQFIKVTYREVQWPSRPKVDTKTTDTGKVLLVVTNPRREEKDKQQGGKGGNKQHFNKSPPLHARWGATGRSER